VLCRDSLDNPQKYTPKQQARKPYTAMVSAPMSASRDAPWLPVALIHQLVALYATPIRKLGINQVTGSALDK